jgi:hypothetical protein
MNIRAMVCFCYVLNNHVWDEEGEMRRRQMVAAFDVDEACLVATPFDSDMKRLPHPEDKGMSVCWIVERMDREEEKECVEIEAARVLECDESDDLYWAA